MSKRYRIGITKKSHSLFTVSSLGEGEILFPVNDYKLGFLQTGKDYNCEKYAGVIFALKDIDSNEELVLKGGE